jgi:hypothetical protein
MLGEMMTRRGKSKQRETDLGEKGDEEDAEGSDKREDRGEWRGGEATCKLKWYFKIYR